MSITKAFTKEKSVTLAIGDITIALQGVNRNQYAYPPYSLFFNHKKPDVTLTVEKDTSLSSLKEAELIFKAKESWSLFKRNNDFVIKTTAAHLLIDADFKSGSLFLEPLESDEVCEFPLTYPLAEIVMINLLSQQRGVLVHSCGILKDSKGYLFVGASGRGKSTMAHLWNKAGCADILSDDRIILRNHGNRFFMYGTPWHGEAHFSSSKKATLGTIFFLHHASKNYVKKISHAQAACALLASCFAPFWDKQGMQFSLDFCLNIAAHTPCYELGFIPDQTIIDFIHNLS